MLKMEQIEAIRRMSQSESISTIARTLGIDWKTAQKYADKDDFNEAVEEKVKERRSKLDPYKPIIDELLEKEEQQNIPRKQRFTAKRMHSYLVETCGIEELRNSYITVSRYFKARRIEKRRNYYTPGTMPLVWHPGEAQGDFGEALFRVNGEERMMHYFVMTFPNSNRRIALVMPGENCECVCTALQEIFTFIGGVPSRIVFDNATGIGRRVQKILEMNEGFSRFRLHYRFNTTFANPRSGWEKGSVENAVGTIRRNLFVPVRMITGSIAEYNRTVMMRDSFEFEADEIHYRKGRVQSLIWQEEDKEALHALPEKSFIVHRIDSMTTSKTGSLVLDSKHVYNLGPLHPRQAVLVEKTAFNVSFYTRDGAFIKTFDRLYGEDPQEVYDIEQLLAALVRKTGAWHNSYVREHMEDGPLKEWLDSRDSSQLRSNLSILSSASGVFGFADTCLAASRLVMKGHFPSLEDLESYCSRLRECDESFSLNTTGVSLSMYDRLLAKEAL